MKGFPPPSDNVIIGEEAGLGDNGEGEGGVSCVSLSCLSLRLGLGGTSDSPAVTVEMAGLGERLGDFPLGERGRRFPALSPRAVGVVPASSDLSSLTTGSPGLGLRRLLEIGLKALFGERTTL